MFRGANAEDAREPNVPWSAKQQQVARAVEHGWKPTGSAKGFTWSFASQVLEESGKKKRKRGTLGELAMGRK